MSKTFNFFNSVAINGLLKDSPFRKAFQKKIVSDNDNNNDYDDDYYDYYAEVITTKSFSGYSENFFLREKIDGLTFPEFCLLNAFYSVIDENTLEIKSKDVYEVLYPRGQWRHSNHNNLMSTIYSLLEKISKIKGKFILKQNKKTYIYDSKKNNLLLPLSSTAYRLEGKQLIICLNELPPLLRMARLQNRIVNIPSEMLSFGREGSLYTRLYIARQVMLSKNEKNNQRASIKFKTMENAGCAIMRDAIHGYMKYLLKNNVILDKTITQSHITWDVVEDIKELKDYIEMKDVKGNIVSMAKTDEIREVNRQLNLFNKFMDNHLVRDAQEKKLNTELYAVYNRSSWECGGRFYGKGDNHYQRLKAEERIFITIDGMKVDELDFSQYHPTILYTVHEAVKPDDVYGFCPERNLGKKVFNTCLNAPSEQSAICAIAKELGDINKYKEKANELIEQCKKHNEAIDMDFCSDAGIRLQNLDAEIALNIMTELRKRKIPCLPVHDSFIVPVNYVLEVKKVMATEYEKRLNCYFEKNKTCPIEIHSAREKYSSMLGKSL